MSHPADELLDKLELRLTHMYKSAQKELEVPGAQSSWYLMKLEEDNDCLDREIRAFRKLRFDYAHMVDIVVEEGTAHDVREEEESTIELGIQALIEAEVIRRLSAA